MVIESKSDPRFRGDRLAPAQAGGRATSGGFTLAEAMIAMVILGIAAAGVLLPFTSGAQVQAEGVHRTLAAKLAGDLMEEIISNNFDDLNDFSIEEDLSALYPNFSRGASCVDVEVPVSPGIYSTNVEFILATVWVKYNGHEMVVIKRLITR
jgi:prepilin-type N-terminal cleavage/methylation domain-containing protein